MGRYIVIRILQGIVTVLAIVTLVFVLVRISGDPLTWLVGTDTTPEVRDRIAADYGLERPIVVQYVLYIFNILRGQFGDSIAYQRPVIDAIMQRLPATVELTVIGVLFALGGGVFIGVYSGAKRGALIDRFGRLVAFLGMSSPSFVVGMIFIYIFAVWAKLLPVGGRFSSTSVILPAATFSVWLAAGVVRITRSAILDVVDADYLVFGRAKGVSERMVLWKHAFKNASIPIITYTMFLLVIAVSGDIVIENVFAWPGLGRLTIEAVIARDYPLVQGIAFLIVFLFVAMSLVADIAYCYVDPRIRYTRRG